LIRHPRQYWALGPESDEEMMERIAEDTGGLYRFAALPAGLEQQGLVESPTAVEGLEPPLGVPQAPAQGYEWAYRLAGIYDFFEGEVEGRERIQVEEMTIPDDFGGWYETTVFIDQSVSAATFSSLTINGVC
jgi:hypothetical protein